MRNAMRILGCLGVAALAIAIATPASANCIPNKTANNIAAYWSAPAGSAQTGATGLRGRFWTLGNRAGGNEGTCQVDATEGQPGACGGASYGWLYFYPPAGAFSINAVLGSAPVAGCPSNTIVVLAETTTGSGSGAAFHAGTAPEVGGGFDLGQNGAQNFVTIPRPKVTSSTRSGTNVILNISVDPITGASSGPSAAAAVTGYRVVTTKGTADPGRAGSYPTILGNTTGTGGSSFSNVTLDCTDTASDYFVGVQVLFDQSQVSYTGAVTRINCNPALAEPKFKIVPKKVGAKPGLNPNN